MIDRLYDRTKWNFCDDALVVCLTNLTLIQYRTIMNEVCSYELHEYFVVFCCSIVDLLELYHVNPKMHSFLNAVKALIKPLDLNYSCFLSFEELSSKVLIKLVAILVEICGFFLTDINFCVWLIDLVITYVGFG